MKEKLILIVEDDPDDSELLIAALAIKHGTNKYLCFQKAEEALTYLKTTSKETFLIISDVNMPLMNGLDFKKKINADIKLKKKNIPFVFLSTSILVSQVNEAFSLSIQGYFQKPSNVAELDKVAVSIMEYWKFSQHPSA